MLSLFYLVKKNVLKIPNVYHFLAILLAEIFKLIFYLLLSVNSFYIYLLLTLRENVESLFISFLYYIYVYYIVFNHLSNYYILYKV